MNKDEKPSWGGFFYTNIRKWIIDEMFSSGDPYNMLMNIQDVISEIEDIQDEQFDDWEDILREEWENGNE